MKETKSIKISPKVHRKVKMYVTKTEQNITDFADKALLNQIVIEKTCGPTEFRNTEWKQTPNGINIKPNTNE